MTGLAWGVAALLAALIFVAVANVEPSLAFLLLAALPGLWLAIGLWVRLDAQRRGYDGDRMGLNVVLRGPIGLVEWLRLRRGMDDKP